MSKSRKENPIYIRVPTLGYYAGDPKLNLDSVKIRLQMCMYGVPSYLMRTNDQLLECVAILHVKIKFYHIFTVNPVLS